MAISWEKFYGEIHNLSLSKINQKLPFIKEIF